MNKLMLITILFMVLLVGSVSAFEFDNSLRYENDDMKVTIENVWGLPLFGSDLGIVELKSHSSVDEILKFGYGAEEVVMYYDFVDWELYENGLGKVIFTNKTSGEIIQKDYYFVEWKLKQVEVNDYKNVIIGKENNGTNVYERQLIGSHFIEEWGWEKYESKDIPNRNIRIGIMVYINKGDYIDAVWTIAGKEIEKHAGWQESWNVDLVSYYKLDEQDTSGSGTIIDSVENNNGTNSGGDNVTGQILTAYNFVKTNPDFITVSDSASLDITGSMTVNVWMKYDINNGMLISKSDSTIVDGWDLLVSGSNIIIWRVDQSDGVQSRADSIGTLSSGTWYMITGVYRAGDRLEIFIDGVSNVNDTGDIEAAQLASNRDLLIADDTASTIPYDGVLDEVFIASRDWSATEILDLYNAQKDGFVNGSYTTDFAPIITLNSPPDNFNTTNNTINFNGTVTLPINVTLYIDGVLNETNSSGIEGDYIFTKVLGDGNHNWTYEACNSEGCSTAITRTLTIGFIENTQLFNTSSFETASETFIINITTNGTIPTNGKLIYNGTTFSSVTITNTAGNDFNLTKTIDIPLTVETKPWFFNFTLAGTEVSSSTKNQIINLTNFSICDGGLTDDFLNISFKDEDDLSVLNASIPTSTFVYYLGSGIVNKTYTFSNTTNNYNYIFCATPDETLNIDAFVQYKQGTDYPQRIYDPDVISYTSTVTNQILYLLNSLDGIFVTFQVINSIEQGISGVDITGTREISGGDVEIASGTTDAAGSITFWLNPDFLHTFTFIKTGFTTFVTSLFPTQPSYTITLTGGEGTGAFDYSRGIAISTRPISAVLNDTLYNFNYTISSSFWVLEEFGFTLSYSNGTIIGTQTSTANTGGTLGLDATTGSNGSIIMEYYYLINSTYINATSTWYIFKSNEYSIQHLLERVVTYIDADMLGVQSDDEGYFFKAVFSVLILISITGILSTRYGLASEQAVSGIIFGVLLLLNTFNLIPTPPGTTFANLGNFLVALVGFILVVSIFKEESR